MELAETGDVTAIKCHELAIPLIAITAGLHLSRDKRSGRTPHQSGHARDFRHYPAVGLTSAERVSMLQAG